MSTASPSSSLTAAAGTTSTTPVVGTDGKELLTGDAWPGLFADKLIPVAEASVHDRVLSLAGRDPQGSRPLE